MAEVIGLGISHWPRLATAEEGYSIRLHNSLRDPHIPAEAKDPANWPEPMRREWGDDQGLSHAAAHREGLLVGMRRVRARLDAFQPDAVVIWGDDQYENFREDIVPPFCVLAYQDDFVSKPFKTGNIWGMSTEDELRVRSAPEIGHALASSLLQQDFDVAYAYKPLHFTGLSHAFANAMMYLNFDQPDKKSFAWPVLPVPINCYGSHVLSHRGSVPVLHDTSVRLDPPSPSPRRCFELGRATARFFRSSPWRVALMASSSWSHAFLVSKHWQLYPDVPADRRLYNALVAGDYKAWTDTPLADMVDAGQQEVLNWFCLAGAMSELNAPLEWSSFVESYVFNSNKVAAIFAETGRGG